MTQTQTNANQISIQGPHSSCSISNKNNNKLHGHTHTDKDTHAHKQNLKDASAKLTFTERMLSLTDAARRERELMVDSDLCTNISSV